MTREQKKTATTTGADIHCADDLKDSRINNGLVCFNRVPYKVRVPTIQLYFKVGNDCNPLFIEVVTHNGCNATLTPCTLTIDKEVFYNGYTYCHIKSDFIKNRWIRIADIEEKVSE